MRISRFSNDISSSETHSNEYAAGTVSQQSFTQRKAIERQRKIIQSYNSSQIGQSYVQRGEFAHPKPRPATASTSTSGSRQEMNANGGTIPERSAGQPISRQAINATPSPAFREPPMRGYNPYG